MKKFLITIVAVFLIVTGTNASGSLNASKSTRSFYADFVMRSCLKKLQKAFTPYTFYSHYDSGSGQTWMLVGNDNASTGMTITGAYYMSGGTPVSSSWIDSPPTFDNYWYWIDSNTVHATCKVHYNESDLGYFIVDDDMVLAIA